MKSFSEEPGKFLEELSVFYKSSVPGDSKEAQKILAVFTAYWKDNHFDGNLQTQVIETCNKLLKQKLPANPYFILYLNNLNLLVGKNFESVHFSNFNQSINYCFAQKNTQKILSVYLQQMMLLLEQNAFQKENIATWYPIGNKFSIVYDTVPAVHFDRTSLVCQVRSDSVVIRQTSGFYYPLTQSWAGKGGEINWSRVGLDTTKVFAKLSTYTVNFKVNGFSADSVNFYYTNYFRQPVLGRLEDKASPNIAAEKTLYPKFIAYANDIAIPKLYPNIDFLGSFTLEGIRVLGRGIGNEVSTMIVSRENKPFISLKSKEFVIYPNRFVSERTRTTFFFGNDSLYHPEVQVRFDTADRKMSFYRGEIGLAQSPFFDSYHKLDIYSEVLMWSCDSNKFSFEALKGFKSQNKAMFASVDFYSDDFFQKLKGQDDVHPVNAMMALSRKYNTKELSLTTIVEYFKKPEEQVKAQLVRLASIGLIDYNAEKQWVVVKPRLQEFLAAKNGVKDYDILVFNSVVNDGSNAELDFKSMKLQTYGVKGVMLSDSQFVYIEPFDQKLVFFENRNFSFNGHVHSGYFDFYANDCYFDYEKFKINLAKIDSLAMSIPAWTPEASGEYKLQKVRNVICSLSGELLINAPASKSGRKSLRKFPEFKSTTESFVYFDSPRILNGTYLRDKFYYVVQPFTMDSLNFLRPEQLIFKGKLFSSIFPEIEEPLRLLKDYSLGFEKKLSPQGLPIYANKATFFDTIRLSNKGLSGSGKINYLTSTLQSNEILFTIDSAQAQVQDLAMRAQAAPSEYPDAKGKNLAMKWFPGKDTLSLKNDKSNVITLFGGKVKLSGAMMLTSKGVKASGQMSFEEVLVSSDSYALYQNSFTSDSANFILYAEDKKTEALKVNGYKTAIDFTTRKGHFVSPGENEYIKLAVNNYTCKVDEFDWLMDQKQLKLVNYKTQANRDKYLKLSQDELIALSTQENSFFSTDKSQDSLSFFALQANYDINTNVLKVEGARILRIADAAIFPANGNLTVGKDGKIENLKSAVLIADTSNRLHKFYNADLTVQGRKSYSGSGLYDYVPDKGDVQTIAVKSIQVDKNGQTVASAKVSDSAEFKLNSWFAFQGTADLAAARKGLSLNGYFKILQVCEKIPQEWIKLKGVVDPKDVKIPIDSSTLKNIGNGYLRAAVVYSGTANTIKPAFLAKADNSSDPNIVAADGLLTYDSKKNEYILAPKQKFSDPEAAGDKLSLSIDRCILHHEGKINFVDNLPYTQVTSTGTLDYFLIPDSLKANALVALDFPFSAELLDIFAKDVNSSELEGIEILSPDYQLQLKEFVGKETVGRLLGEISSYGQYRKFPEQLNHPLVFADLKLHWNPDTRGFVSNQRIGINNVGTTNVLKYANGYIEFLKRRTGDQFSFYLDLGQGKWYYFNFANGIFQAISSNADFNAKLAEIPEKKRMLKPDKEDRTYEFIISTNEKKNSFLRKMIQTFGQ